MSGELKMMIEDRGAPVHRHRYFKGVFEIFSMKSLIKLISGFDDVNDLALVINN
jgi:hypothetical protein